MSLLRAALAFAALMIVASAHAADAYPTRPIRIVVGIPPGGAPDIVARVLADKLSHALAQPVVVDNKAGANGNIAAETVAKAAPDGYTLLLGQDAIFVINPHLYRLPIDPRRDLEPVAPVAWNMFVLSVNPSLPVRTFPEFVDHARKSNPPLNYASGGNGSVHHLTMELLKQRAGINLVHVPYRGGTPATTATLAGEVAAMFAGTSTAPQIKAGKLRALAVTGTKRSEAFPDVPTIAEFYPGFEMSIWLGLFAPAGTPQGIVTRLRDEVSKALALADLKERFAAAGGVQPLVLSPAEFSGLIERDFVKYQKLIRSTGVKID